MTVVTLVLKSGKEINLLECRPEEALAQLLYEAKAGNIEKIVVGEVLVDSPPRVVWERQYDDTTVMPASFGKR